MDGSRQLCSFSMKREPSKPPFPGMPSSRVRRDDRVKFGIVVVVRTTFDQLNWEEGEPMTLPFIHRLFSNSSRTSVIPAVVCSS